MSRWLSEPCHDCAFLSAGEPDVPNCCLGFTLGNKWCPAYQGHDKISDDARNAIIQRKAQAPMPGPCPSCGQAG